MPEALKFRHSFYSVFSNSRFKRRKNAKGCLIPLAKNTCKKACHDHDFSPKLHLQTGVNTLRVSPEYSRINALLLSNLATEGR